MKKFLFALTALFVIGISACQKNENESIEPSSGEVLRVKANPASEPLGAPLSQAVIDKKIQSTLEEKHGFEWTDMSLPYLWSAAQYGNHAVAVGYKTLDITDIAPIIH